MKEFYDRRIEGHSWANCSSQEDVNFLSITKVPILVARYAGKYFDPEFDLNFDCHIRITDRATAAAAAVLGSPNLLEKVEDAVRIYQVNLLSRML